MVRIAAALALAATVAVAPAASASETTVGSCNAIGPDRSAMPIVGFAAYAGPRTVDWIELRCTVRPGETVVLNLFSSNLGPSASTTRVTELPAGSLELCTMVNAHFADGSESNPSETSFCRPLLVP